LTSARPRLAPDQKKDVRVTICLTRALSERMSRAAAYAGVSRSEFVEGMLRRECEVAPTVEDGELEQAEERNVAWRDRMGL
jgi:metal-responsive CopG/Arc/MetJ family transcriptional regulator